MPRQDVTPPRLLRSHAQAGPSQAHQEAPSGPESGHQARDEVPSSESSSLSSLPPSLPSSRTSSRPLSKTSRPTSTGDDHGFRQRVAEQYTISAVNKVRLRYCIFIHYFLTFAMLAKLTPYILDQFNFFILAIEELQVPEPLSWEWVWLSSFMVNVLALDATKRNSARRMKQYMVGIGLLGIGPLLYAVIYWLPEVIIYLTMDYDDPNYDFVNDYLYFLAYWKGYPCGLLWFAFVTVAIQVHVFANYFSYNLIQAWRARGISQE